MENEQENEGMRRIREGLEQRLSAYNLKERIEFDDSAIEELYKLSDGNWKIAEVYAALAILDAFEDRRNQITGENIRETNFAEAFILIRGGQDPWEQVKYIGTNVPTMEPEGVKLRRTLSMWDADRDFDARKAVDEGRLPQYALPDKIEYSDKGVLGNPEVKIPFRYDPSKVEVGAVASLLARFVSEKTGEPQEVKDVSHPTSGIQFFVQPVPEEGMDPLLIRHNYRVREDLGFFVDGNVQGMVVIEEDLLCKYDGILKAFAEYIKREQK